METIENNTESIPSAPQTLGGRIRAVRMAWGWSQEKIARALRVDQASISFWERDKIKPSGSALVALAALFRMTIDALEKGGNFVIPAAPGRRDEAKKTIKLPRGVCLPASELDKVTIIDLSSGNVEAPYLSEALIGLGQYAKDGRRVWIVVE